VAVGIKKEMFTAFGRKALQKTFLNFLELFFGLQDGYQRKITQLVD
jgi:hypothetical protein